MDRNSPEFKQSFFEQIIELQALYVGVKEMIVLAENINPKGKTFLALLNEPRNAFDHVIRSLDNTHELEKEFNEAKEHLYRAGYDAFEIIASSLCTQIVKDLKRYSASTISSVFPAYYKEHRPMMLKLQHDIAATRAHKKADPETGIKSFQEYATSVQALEIIQREVTIMIPDLEIQHKKKFLDDWLYKIMTAVIGGLIVYGLTHIQAFKPIEAEPIKSNQGRESTKPIDSLTRFTSPTDSSQGR